MPLPKVDLPTYKAKLLSIDDPVTFRPYTVREEKAMLLAFESRDEKEIIASIENLVSSCVIGDIDIRQLPAFDLEYLFLQIRCRSVSQVAEFRMVYNGCETTTEACYQEFKIDLSKLEVVEPTGHTKRIPITDTIGVVMRYPSMEMMEKMTAASKKKMSQIETMYDIIGRCIESVWHGKKVIVADTIPASEIQSFIEDLSREQFTKILAFFETMPAVQTTVKRACEKCGKHVEMEVKGLANFFS
jgi:hypothetical protein